MHSAPYTSRPHRIASPSSRRPRAWHFCLSIPSFFFTHNRLCSISWLIDRSSPPAASVVTCVRKSSLLLRLLHTPIYCDLWDSLIFLLFFFFFSLTYHLLALLLPHSGTISDDNCNSLSSTRALKFVSQSLWTLSLDLFFVCLFVRSFFLCFFVVLPWILSSWFSWLVVFLTHESYFCRRNLCSSCCWWWW